MIGDSLTPEFIAVAWALTFVQAAVVFSWIGYKAYKHFTRTKMLQ